VTARLIVDDDNGGAGVTDGDKGDVVVSEDGTVWMVPALSALAQEVLNEVAARTSAINAEATSRANADNLRQLLSEKGVPNGYAGLDGNGHISDAVIPASIARDSEITTAVTNAINALLNGASSAADTLAELEDLLGDQDTALQALLTQVGTKANADASNIVGATWRTALGLVYGTDIYSKATIDAMMALVALDANVVHKTGDETISGTKTFATVHGTSFRSAAATDTYLSFPSGEVAFNLGGSQRFRMSTGDFYANTATGPLIENAGSSSTNPTIVPRRDGTNNGLGGGSGELSLIISSIEKLKIAAGLITATVPIAVPASAYDEAAWNGSLEVVTKDAFRDKIETLAPLNSPGLTGTPTAPTAAPGTNTTQVATTAFTKAAIDALAAVITTDQELLDALAALSAVYQALDADLGELANLNPSNDDLLQQKAGVWTNRTPAQVKTDLALAKGDVGLGSVDNTSDANKPISTAQQTALDAKQAFDQDLTDIANLADAEGDIIIRGAAGWERLPKSATATHVLTAGATKPEWAAPSGGGGGASASPATKVLIRQAFR
jgi:hypothetical protein